MKAAARPTPIAAPRQMAVFVVKKEAHGTSKLQGNREG